MTTFQEQIRQIKKFDPDLKRERKKEILEKKKELIEVPKDKNIYDELFKLRNTQELAPQRKATYTDHSGETKGHLKLLYVKEVRIRKGTGRRNYDVIYTCECRCGNIVTKLWRQLCRDQTKKKKDGSSYRMGAITCGKIWCKRNARREAIKETI